MTQRNGHTLCMPHSLGARVTPQWVDGARDSYIFMRNPSHIHTNKPQTLEYEQGSLMQAEINRAEPCATDPKTSEETRNALMRSVRRTSNLRGASGKGRLQTIQGMGR